MAYHTLEDLKGKLTAETVVQLTDDKRTGRVDTRFTDDAATAAAGIIDGYLMGRYALPLPSTPNLIREVSLTLAADWLYQRRMGLQKPDRIVTERDSAMKLLQHIQEGKICLFAEDRSAVMMTNKTAVDKEFTKEVLAGF